MADLRRFSALVAALALLFAAGRARAAELRAPLSSVPTLALPAAPVPAVGGAMAVPASPQAAAPLPALAPSMLPVAIPAAGAYPDLAAPGSQPLAAASSSGKAPEALAGEAARLFDGARIALSNSPRTPEPAPPSPKVPAGLDYVERATVRTEADVWRLIPSGHSHNSESLTRKLADSVDKMQPYDIYTYYDKNGGKTIAIDLSRKPELVELLPEQQSHEVRLIKKIQAWNLDLQVVVREEGATPDLIIGGMFTELKTRMGGGPISYLLNKANSQVASHAERHPRLGPGAVVIDLDASQDGVPMARVALELEMWRRSMLAAGRVVALKKIYVFGGTELREFDRRADGSYAPADKTALPFVDPKLRAGAAYTLDPADRARIESTVRQLWGKGRYRAVLRAWKDFSASVSPEETARMHRRMAHWLDSAEEKVRNPKPRYRR